MPPLGSSPDASIAEASSRSLQAQRTPAEQEQRRKDRLAKRQKKLEAKQRDRDHSISGQRKEEQSFTAAHRPEPKYKAVPARIVEPENEERNQHRKRARSQSRKRDRSPSPYRSTVRARSKSHGHGNGSEEMSYSRVEADESSSDDSDDSRGDSRFVQGPNKRTKLEDDLERTALLTFRLRPSSSQFERVLDGVPSLATAQEHVRTKFHLGKTAVFRLSSESPLGGIVVLEDEEDFRAFKLRVLRSRAESTVITVDVAPAERHPAPARISASTSPSPAHNSMLPPYVKQSAAQAALKAPPMASTPVQVPAAKPKPSDTRPTDRAAVPQASQALPPPILPAKRPAPPPSVPAAESGPYVPPSLRAKYAASSASTCSASPNIVPALLPKTKTSTPTDTSVAPSASVQLDPGSSASAPLNLTDPTKVGKAEAAKLRKGPSASQKWVEARIREEIPCGICMASPFHACYTCPDLIRGGLSYAEQRLGELKLMGRKRPWHKAAIKDLEAVIANTKAVSAPSKSAPGSAEADKAFGAGDEAAAPAQMAAPLTSAANATQDTHLSPPATSLAAAPASASSSSSPALAAARLEVDLAANAEGDEAPTVGQPTAQDSAQQPLDEEQDELAATQEMEQRQSQLAGPGAAQVTSAIPVTGGALTETAASLAPETSDAVPSTNAPDKDGASPNDADTAGPSRSQRLTERQAQRQLKQRETKWNKIRKDCAAAQDKVREYLARETRGESLHGAAKYHFTRNRNTLKQKTAELEELDSELSDFATKMNLPRPPRAPELDFTISEAEVRRSPRVAVLQKSPVPASSGDAESSVAQQREGEASGTQTESQGSNAPSAVPAKKQAGRLRKLAVSSDTQGEDPPENSKSRKSLSDIAQTIDTGTAQTVTPAARGHKARIGLRTPLSEHSEDDVETSPILRSVPSEQATEKIDEQPLPPPVIQATASPRITRRRSQTTQPTVTENENDADDELDSAAEGPRPTPRSPVKRGGQAGSPTGKAVSASADGDGPSKGSEAQTSQSSTAPPSSALTLPDPSQAPSRRITRQAVARLPSSSSSGSETSDDSDDTDEEMRGEEVVAEEDAEDDDEAESDGAEGEASDEDDAGGADQGGTEEDEEDEIEATQVAKGPANGSGTHQQDRSASPASSHTRSRSNSAASSINSAASKEDKAADEEEEDVASSSSTAILSDREEEADPISTFSMQPASARPPVEPVQAPRSSGIFSSFNFFQSNRNSQDVNATKAAMTQPNGISGRSANGANHSASQPTPGRRPKLSMPRLSELDASVLLRRRQQPNESAASSQASTPVVATMGQHLAAPVAAADDDDEGPDEADDDDSGSESASSSSDSSSDSDDGKKKTKASPAQKKGKAGAAKSVVPASKRASVAVEAKKKRKGLADLF